MVDYPPIPQQWRDLWASIKAETADADEALKKLGAAIAAELETGKPAEPPR